MAQINLFKYLWQEEKAKFKRSDSERVDQKVHDLTSTCCVPPRSSFIVDMFIMLTYIKRRINKKKCINPFRDVVHNG